MEGAAQKAPRHQEKVTALWDHPPGGSVGIPFQGTVLSLTSYDLRWGLCTCLRLGGVGVVIGGVGSLGVHLADKFPAFVYRRVPKQFFGGN